MKLPDRDLPQETEPSNIRSENPQLIEATERFLDELEAGGKPSVEDYVQRGICFDAAATQAEVQPR